MPGFFQTIGGWDRAAMSFGESLRWPPLTAVLVVASAWWMKWPAFAAIGAVCDASRRRWLPAAAVATAVAAALTGVAVSAVKVAFDRPRPAIADPGLDVVGAVPASASFPSGHSATAFAAAVAVGLVYPRLRWPLLVLAVAVALSRVYLGMHYVTDVAAGSALGVGIGLGTAWAVLQAVDRRRDE